HHEGVLHPDPIRSVVRQWLVENRLDGYSQLVASIQEDDIEKLAIMKRLRDNAVPSVMKLQQLMAEIT
ncbi:MAG: hypothetical protein AAGL97_14125, partial [Pseudomonadota bacterium]